jgi:Ras-related protein Rab-18
MLTRSCTQGVIYAYDVTRRETFESIQQTWMKEVESSSTIEKAVKMVVATKVDRDSEREVSRQEGAMFAKSKGCLFVETSAKANTAVTQVGFSLTFCTGATPSTILGDAGHIFYGYCLCYVQYLCSSQVRGSCC